MPMCSAGSFVNEQDHRNEIGGHRNEFKFSE